jgi:hypothetical protein
MTAKNAATAITALIAIAFLTGCKTTLKHATNERLSPGAFESQVVPGAPGCLVAGDALGVELHLAACDGWLATAAP